MINYLNLFNNLILVNMWTYKHMNKSIGVLMKWIFIVLNIILTVTMTKAELM